MFKLCLTGGPGSGKTVIFNHLAQVLEERGYHVFFVPETAPELLLNGIAPNEYVSNVAFWNLVLNKQLDKERLYNSLVQYYPKDKSVIVFDRGILDIGLELEPSVFEGMLQKRKMTIQSACDHYDAVLHLVTAADGAEDFYQWNDPSKEIYASNLATESPAEAREKDHRIQKLWRAHDNLHVIESEASFNDKVKHALSVVFQMLNEPPVRHNLRKFVIKRPTQAELHDLGCIFRTNVVTTYLVQHDPKIDRRVVQRGTAETGYSHYYVEKVHIDVNEEDFITERRIDYHEYVNYLTEADHSVQPVAKFRYCFVFEKRYYEVEMYAFESEYAILEIEHDVSEKLKFPPFSIVREVSNMQDFSSRALSKKKEFKNVKHSKSIPVWTYETGREERGPTAHETRFYGVELTNDLDMAMKLFRERGRNYLFRHRTMNGSQQFQRYDAISHVWIED